MRVSTSSSAMCERIFEPGDLAIEHSATNRDFDRREIFSRMADSPYLPDLIADTHGLMRPSATGRAGYQPHRKRLAKPSHGMWLGADDLGLVSRNGGSVTDDVGRCAAPVSVNPNANYQQVYGITRRDAQILSIGFISCEVKPSADRGACPTNVRSLTREGSIFRSHFPV
jgi:hypothetical protein